MNILSSLLLSDGRQSEKVGDFLINLIKRLAYISNEIYNKYIELRKNKKTKKRKLKMMLKRTVIERVSNKVMDETIAEDAYDMLDKLVAKGDYHLLNALEDYTDWQWEDDIDDEYAANQELIQHERNSNYAAIMEDLKHVTQGEGGQFKIVIKEFEEDEEED